MASDPTAFAVPPRPAAATPSVGTTTPSGVNQWLFDHRTRPLPRVGVREELETAVQARTSELEIEIAALRREADQLCRTEQELSQALASARAALAARTAMLGSLARELRVPLNTIHGVSQRLTHPGLSAGDAELLEHVRHNSEQLLRVVDDLQEFTRNDSGGNPLVPVDFDLATAMRVAVDLHAELATRQGVELLVEVDPAVPARVRGDRKRLQQVLIKLIGHAVRGTTRGQIVVRAGLERTLPMGWTLRFQVTDIGSTLPASVQATLFEPDPPANGGDAHLVSARLGFAVTKRLVQAMGGKIGVTSTPATGSTFWFTIEVKPPLDTKIELCSAASLAGKHVLLVDDNPTNRRLFARLANIWKVRVALADSAETALDYLREAASAGTPVELVLLEYPAAGPDPFATAKVIQSLDLVPRPAIALLTSRCETLTTAELNAHGITACEAKPLRPRTLRAMLIRALLPLDTALNAGKDGFVRAAASA